MGFQDYGLPEDTAVFRGRGEVVSSGLSSHKAVAGQKRCLSSGQRLCLSDFKVKYAEYSHFWNPM